MNFRQVLLVLGFSVSSSLDNFGVGISYGVNQIRIGAAANLLIAAIAFIFSMTGVAFGTYLTRVMPGELSTIVGALLVLFIGLRVVLLAMSQRRQHGRGRREKAGTTPPGLGPSTQHAETVPSTRGGISRYLVHPEQADKDRSGEISLWEAAGLGIALSANALTNGLGAGMMHVPALAISILAAVFSYLAIWSGVQLGAQLAAVRIGRWSVGEFSTILSGLILLAIAAHMLFSIV
ncbi:MAG: sporulation membrane protein YtaF [Alicyclobacillus macrosporangiidus]|uniref:sporulation membrane protein YtaF n=1 Tax=Alicyclobacillus macrosporangiidus TaxID=392015 RepID=UPI0026F10B8D|nr:sporulation membrane protein YtaF [Alicyclobacillus macrosporangiidus]MCL6599889.1 sporulation membrane protein YtaF [Alicyclobacillus macrosporangiidus]